MGETTQFRLACAFYGALCVATILFLAGPYLWGGIAFTNMSLAIRIACIAITVLALWFFVVSLFAETRVAATIGSLGLAQDAILLVLPYMVFIGTRSIYGNLRRGAHSDKKP